MVVYRRDVLDLRAADLYGRIDSNGNGDISAQEAMEGVRKIEHNKALRGTAADVFGLVPRSATELLRWVKRSPKQEAQARIIDLTPGTTLPPGPTATAADLELGRDSRGHLIAITGDGNVTVDGQRPEGVSAMAHAMDGAAELAPVLLKKPMPPAQQHRLCAVLCEALASAAGGTATEDKDALFSGAIALLVTLGRVCEGNLRLAVVDRVLWALTRQQNGTMREFYLGLASVFFEPRFDAAQRFACEQLLEATVRSSFPVEAWTENRTKPLRVAQVGHPEFWRRIVGYYRSRGFKLLSKNANDSRRVYERVMTDPTGSKAPLTVRVELKKGETNLYAKIDRPDVHVLVYDGHWELGGNGSESIEKSPKSRPGTPKLIVQDACRTIQNYDELIDKHRDAMVIGTMLPVAVESDHPILDVIFDGIVRGETLAWVRKRLSKKEYFSRNEFLKLRQRSDLDNDNRADTAPSGLDLHFDVYGKRTTSRFVKAIENANTALHYHHEQAVEEGKHSRLGPGLSDHLVAGGRLEDPKPGEVVRVTPVERTNAKGKTETFFEVQYNKAYMNRADEEYAGIVTAHIIMDLTRRKYGEVTDFDRLRAIVLGAMAIQFLGVGAGRGNGGMRGYLAHFGLPPIPPKTMIEFLQNQEGYGDNGEVKRFIKLLAKYGYDAGDAQAKAA